MSLHPCCLHWNKVLLLEVPEQYINLDCTKHTYHKFNYGISLTINFNIGFMSRRGSIAMKRLLGWDLVSEPASVHPSKNIPSENLEQQIGSRKWEEESSAVFSQKLVLQRVKLLNCHRQTQPGELWMLNCPPGKRTRQDMTARKNYNIILTRYSQDRMYESFHLQRWIHMV